MTCDCEGTIVELEVRIIEIPNLFLQIQKLGFNPYFEYHKHPIIEKCIDDGINFIIKTNPSIPKDAIKTKFVDNVYRSTIILYMEYV